VIGKLFRRRLRKEGRLAREILERYCAPPNKREPIGKDYSNTDFGRLYFEHRGRAVHKWVHYLPIYERYFAPFRGEAITFLEIGVSNGGSLDLWRKFFGERATIYGIDVKAECAERVTAPNQVRIGSQDDPEFLRRIVSEMGGALDIVLDDGSHIGRHQIKSFDVLFPFLRDNGLYIIEDMHTSYWRGLHEGQYGKASTAIGFLKGMIDDMHAWYHERGARTPAKTEVGAIHIYDSLAIIEKTRRLEPMHIKIS
jgi:hypothetical protein